MHRERCRYSSIGYIYARAAEDMPCHAATHDIERDRQIEICLMMARQAGRCMRGEKVQEKI